MANNKVKNDAITSRDEDFAQWYTDVCRKAELMDYSSVKGFIIYRPYGYALWEMIQAYMDKKFKETGHENVYMPLLIPESLLQKEADHVEGFAPECAVVTRGGLDNVEENLIIRPTSETLFCEHYAKIVNSYRDLPKLYNQWCSVVRWEKTTRPFLRGSEFLWQEGHTIHATKEEARAKALEMIKLVGIPRAEEIMECYPHELSGGMRQRIMIAMALVCNPKLLIADEPTTALDVTIQAQILDLMRKLKEEMDMSIMLITHDLGVVAEMADYVVVMYAGNVVEKGKVLDIFQNPMHPYTIGLLKSKPIIGKTNHNERLYSIPGQVPNPINMPENCHFNERCEFCQEGCKEKEPKLVHVGNGHYVACFVNAPEKEEV